MRTNLFSSLILPLKCILALSWSYGAAQVLSVTFTSLLSECGDYFSIHFQHNGSACSAAIMKHEATNGAFVSFANSSSSPLQHLVLQILS